MSNGICPDLRQFNFAMTGRINVRLVIVRGPDGTAAGVSALEMVRMRAIVLAGTRFLSILASANSPVPRLTWSVRTDIAQIAVPPQPNPNPDPHVPAEGREAPWRDPALQQLVNQTGAAGLEALRLDTLGSADNALTIFFTGYEAQWVAYAFPDRAEIVLSWPLFDRPGIVRTRASLSAASAVVAHELCHIFGAPDEYASSGCKVLDGNPPICGYGVQDFPNFNCENTGGPKLTCLMLDYTQLLMCPPTRVHIGWV
jgi:hypothetical protein